MKILIAEDDPVAMKMLTALLNEWGYETVSAGNGLDAWDHLQSRDAAIMAVMDWQMPGMTGDELCRRARTELPDKPLYLILITARTFGLEDKVRGLNAGADDYLTKPFDFAELRARIQVGERVLKLQTELEHRVHELEKALAQVRHLQGLLPICVHCKKIRDDQNYWHQVESYITARSEAEFTHSICPACFEEQMKQISRES